MGPEFDYHFVQQRVGLDGLGGESSAQTFQVAKRTQAIASQAPCGARHISGIDFREHFVHG